MSDTDLTIETIARLTKENAELRTSNARLRETLERINRHANDISIAPLYALAGIRGITAEALEAKQ